MRLAVLKTTLMVLALTGLVAAECAAAVAPASPKKEKIEPMVVSATLDEQKLSQAPVSIQVVSQEQIREMGADTVSEALEEAVGLTLGMASGRVIEPSIRGSGSMHTLVLIDGRRLAPGYRGISDINQIPTLMIDRIEIVRGPTSALFGSDAIGGVVNVITKKPPKEKPVAGADLKAGTNTHSGGDFVQPQAYGGTDIGPFRFILGGLYKNRNGWDHDNEAPDDGDNLKQQYASGQAAVDLGENHTISFGGYYSKFEREGKRDIQNVLTDRDATDDNADVFARYDGKFAQNYSVMLQAYHSEYKTDADLDPETTDPFFVTDEKYKRTQYEGRFNAKINSFASVTLGGDYRDDNRGADDISPEYDTHNTAGFGQIDMVFFERLNIVAGARYDDHSEFGSEWSPRVTGSYLITDFLRLKASYGHGFRAPTSYELFVTSYKRRGKDTYLGNPDLNPEKSRSFEVGLQSNLDIAQGLDMELTYFYNDIDDMIEAVLISSKGSGKSLKSTYRYENLSEAQTSGVEFLGNLRLPCGWKLGAGLTYLKTENKDTGEQLADQPEFKGNVNLQWHLAKLGLKTRVAYTWYTGIEDGMGNALDNHSTLDAWIGKDIFKDFQVYAGMKNILDEDTEDYEVQPAFVYAGIRWDY